jgi:hypothetical protein
MNPIEMACEIEERYQRYLKTTFYFKDKVLRDSFEDALASGHLSKGPFLEATPIFKRGQTPRSMFPDLLGSQPDEGFLEAVQGLRPLYKHQEEAIRKVLNSQNVVVATGTGSGKTEAFLYPILLHLYQEFRSGNLSPGVRALILYPMNALANDQRERLAAPPGPQTDPGILWTLSKFNSPFQFTFGQYIGETPEDETDSRRHANDHKANRLPGELVFRSEMRKTPPHILLTNYSMLEYLLLRPDDSPLFDKGQAKWWTFLVLDEAHQYRGSRGIEMAMLLRRLKQRLREGGRSESFRCIATSATLVGGDVDISVVADFASDLFGEKFHPENVILGETELITEPGLESLSIEEYHVLRESLNGNIEARSHLGELASRLRATLPENLDVPKIVGVLLQYDRRATNLRNLITGKYAEIQYIADQFFGDVPRQKRVSALSELVDLLLQAKNPSTDNHLLSARYHLFLRSLEGAFVSYWPQKKVFLNRKAGDDEYTAFEIALCRECGQHYFVGQRGFKGGKLMEAIRDPSHLNFGATFFRPIENDKDEVDEEEDNGETNSRQVYQLCVQCGEVHPGKLPCGHDHSIRVVKEESSPDEDRADQIARCSACGYNAAGRDPVREVVHGTDGPHAVIATTLFQILPEKQKKILAFADGRQEAAFFAWYLEDSYKDILSRNLTLKIARSFTQFPVMGISLSTIADQAFSKYHDAYKYQSTDDEPTIRKNIWRAFYREFLTEEQRISLEGVGLIQWSIEWPKWIKFPIELTQYPWSFTEKETHDLILILLDSMRTDRAVELQTNIGVSLNWSDLNLQTYQMRFRIGPPARPKGMKYWPVRSWDGKEGKRCQFLAKLLTRAGMSESEALKQSVNILRCIWESIRLSDEEAPSSRDRLLIPIDDARRLNPGWWRLQLIANDKTIYQCDNCARIQSVSVRGVCPRHHCRGTLKEVCVNDLEPNHYRLTYEEDLPGFLRVEEHTAQLDKEKAREFQREFKQGKIHVLSCSTTFELGVDLGNLDTIFLRNVPPEAFNYAQRVGRAGRRERPGFAITYCRRNPHDLYHFAQPERMLRGEVRPPIISLRNEKIVTRHIAATALSYFFQNSKERFTNVERLFKSLEHPSGVTDFRAFLHEHQSKLEESLRLIVPLDMLPKVGLDNGQWIDRIAGKTTKDIGGKVVEEESRFSLAEAEVSSDYANAIRVRDEAAAKYDGTTLNWARSRANTIASDGVLSFLSRKAVIPKYGFPVDVVELDTQRTQQNQESFEVLLQRDLAIAISEFAPTSKLVANKKVWTSYGLKKVAEKEWPRRFYKRCARHNIFLHWERGQPEPPILCGDQLPVSQYVIPLFGFVTDRDRPREPTSRTPKVFTTRPYFAGSLGTNPGTISLPLAYPLITLTKATPGLMAVLCEGRRGEGFYICGGCGAGFRKRQKAHKTPYGQDCRGTLEQVSLGHEFVTDVLQLQFHPKYNDDIESVWFAYSLAYALVEGAAEILDVPSNDLSATVAHGEQHPVPPIILYDNVPGGAGLVARLESKNVLKTCLETALIKVSGNCKCPESASCYGCLRSYRNQFAHQYLQRGPVMHYLSDIIQHWQD